MVQLGRQPQVCGIGALPTNIGSAVLLQIAIDALKLAKQLAFLLILVLAWLAAHEAHELGHQLSPPAGNRRKMIETDVCIATLTEPAAAARHSQLVHG